MVKIYNASDVLEAERIVFLLKESGIPSFYQDSSSSVVAYGVSGFGLYGVDVFVDVPDAEKALEIIGSAGNTRIDIVSSFYDHTDEDKRLQNTRHGQLEYLTTMHYIHRYAGKGSKVLEIGAGTGRYSVALAEEGMDVTAVEMVESNLEVLTEKCRGLDNIRPYWGDAADLKMFTDDSFDMTLSFGPMYHLYEPDEVNRAVDEAIRVTKHGGVIMFAFVSVYGIMYANYFCGNWALGQKENFTEDYRPKHFKEQLFTGYDVAEFEELFAGRPVEWITTAGTDGMLEAIEERPDFCIPDEDFESFAAWYLSVAEKRELLGGTNHLLYICRKK